MGGLLALLAAAAIAFFGLRRREDDEPSRIAARYGGWMVDVEPRHRPREIVREVTAIEGLARLAERYDRMILHEERNGIHAYLVEEDGMVYRYRLEADGVADERSWLGSVASIGESRR